MPQFFAPIIAGLRFPVKSRGIGECGEWCVAERLQMGSAGWESEERQTGRAEQGGRVYSPAGHQKSTLIRGCFLLCAYSKKPKSEKGKMVNTARLMTSSASI